MAHAVVKSRVHQALHGYADGHRQLALSTSLKPRDQKTLLSLSDISGPGAKIDGAGYITGYPLPESGQYALARTWPAPEMPRPGCVWTHTLLIDYADLPSIEEPKALLELFRRPSGTHSAPEYSKPLALSQAAPIVPTELEYQWARSVVSALYGKPRDPIIAGRPISDADGMVLAIWGQQWPRLKRNFRFCTLSASDRSSDTNSFDLQLLPAGDRSVRTRFAGAVDAEAFPTINTSWLDDAVWDLRTPNDDGLRDFLRRIGSDIAAGREGFRALCQLHRALVRSEPEPSAIAEAIEIVQSEFAHSEAKTARTMVVNKSIHGSRLLDDFSFRYVWDNRSLISSEKLDVAGIELGVSAWQRDPRMLAELNADDRSDARIIDGTVMTLGQDELIEGLHLYSELTPKALNLRPDLVCSSAFWSKLATEEALITATTRNLQANAVSAMIAASRDDLAEHAVAKFGANVILNEVRKKDIEGLIVSHVWVFAAARDPAAVAEFLSSRSDKTRRLLLELMSVLRPDDVPNDLGVDPWVVAGQHSIGSVSDEQTVQMASYLLSRTFGYRTRSPADLFRMSFEIVYAAAAKDRVPHSAWKHLDQRLPTSFFWYGWDRCKRLRAGAADLFLDGKLDISEFATIVSDDWLFSLLAEEVSNRSGGRSFLKAVRRYLKNDRSSPNAHRLDVIEHVLG
ncbi:hypothetical protein ACIQUG_32200 [Ensifer sp. NPDC090286]|uniref:GAP1-N1 domain-containing protein n=1 Tax=Ensifer sp. NPDC090286 TaxID=3363991 RepID=UPI00383A0334